MLSNAGVEMSTPSGGGVVDSTQQFSGGNAGGSGDQSEAVRGDGLASRTGELSGKRSGEGRSVSTHASGPISPQLAKLYEEVGRDEQIVARFVSDYLSLLDKRIATICADLAGDDDEAPLISLLSLETTSVMIGALDVVEAARALRRAVEDNDRSATHALFDALLVETAALRAELARAGYSGTDPPAEAREG
jgi:hypothetical protein